MRLTTSVAVDDLSADAAVLAELGLRIARHRLARNWTQADLAAQADVGVATVLRAEHGGSVQMTSMVRLLRTLGLLEALDAAIPKSIKPPIAQIDHRLRGTRRLTRARLQRPDKPDVMRWSWGDQASRTR
jgi:transcriptional regulator with XRE-family HTH domain